MGGYVIIRGMRVRGEGKPVQIYKAGMLRSEEVHVWGPGGAGSQHRIAQQAQ